MPLHEGEYEQRLLDQDESVFRPQMKTWLEVAIERGVVVGDDDTITGQAFADVGIAILNGCPGCGACVAPYNSFQRSPSDPYAYCRHCI